MPGVRVSDDRVSDDRVSDDRVSDGGAPADRPFDDRRPIISIEDSDEDFMSLRMALRAAGVDNPVERYATGGEAQEVLLGERGESRLRNAAFVLLDLNLPDLSGRELLCDLRRTGAPTPILILSTSGHAADVEACYGDGANAYLVKPLDFSRWEELFAAVARFWLRLVELPPFPPVRLDPAHRTRP